MMTWDQVADFNQRHARTLICNTCAIQNMGLCNNGVDEFCDLIDYIPTMRFLGFMATLANGSSDEAEI